jgi:hypothetical protein
MKFKVQIDSTPLESHKWGAVNFKLTFLFVQLNANLVVMRGANQQFSRLRRREEKVPVCSSALGSFGKVPWQGRRSPHLGPPFLCSVAAASGRSYPPLVPKSPGDAPSKAVRVTHPGACAGFVPVCAGTCAGSLLCKSLMLNDVPVCRVNTPAAGASLGGPVRRPPARPSPLDWQTRPGLDTAATQVRRRVDYP